MPLRSRPEPFSRGDWIYELKYDGFRALAHIRDGQWFRRIFSRFEKLDVVFLAFIYFAFIIEALR